MVLEVQLAEREDADAGAALPGTSPSLDHDDAELSFEKGVQSDSH